MPLACSQHNEGGQLSWGRESVGSEEAAELVLILEALSGYWQRLYLSDSSRAHLPASGREKLGPVSQAREATVLLEI